MSEKSPEQLPPSTTPEQGVELPDIPKSRELFRGDINDTVIDVQLQTGVEIDNGFWFLEVGNDGSTESILDRFDAAYPSLVQEKTFPTVQPEKLQGREKPIVFAGALATQEAFQDNETTPDNRYGSETLDIYSFMASENREKNTPINQEIAAELEEEARTLLAEGLSGTEVAERLGTATVVNQRAAQLLYDIGKDLPGRGTPLEKPKEEWDTDEYLNAKYAVIDGLQEQLTERNEAYARLTESLLEDGLSYRDVLGSEAVRAGTASEHPEHAATYAHELALLALSGRGEEVSKAAQEIRQRFDNMRSLLPESVQLSPYAESQSWIIWDIGKQEALKDKDYPSTMDSSISYSGSVLEGQENNAEQAEFMRNVVAWRHLGWEIHLKITNGEGMGWLDPLLDEQTRSLLQKVGDEAHKGQLSSAEYTDLGRGIESALMRQFVQERPELQTEMQERAQQLLEEYRSNMESTALLGELSKPEARRYTSDEKYRFLVHTVLDDPQITFNYLSGNESSGFRIQSDKPLNTSLIDQKHTATFEGASGLIVQPPDKAADISGIWPGDVAVDMQTNGQPNMTGIEALAATKRDEYNQVHLKAGKVEGVFIRIAADTGKELGYPQTNQALRELATQQGLPVAEIVVNPRDIQETEPLLKEPLPTGNGELYQIVLPHNGYEYKIDVVKQAEGQDVSFVDAEGFAMRMAKIDGYDVWDRNLTADDLTSIQQSLAPLRQSNPEIVQYVERQITELKSRSNNA